MSAPIKTKEELTRLAWITELRRQGHRQCRNALAHRGNVCALGLLAEIASIPLKSIGMPNLQGASGLSEAQLEEVLYRNDGFMRNRPHTFAEIADIVEGWFK